MGKYKIMTGKELGKYVYEKLENGEMIDISFWEEFDELTAEKEIDESNFSSGHGIKNTNIFDEYNDHYPSLLAIGFWGGGSTQVLDCTIAFDEKEIVDFVDGYVSVLCKGSPVVVEMFNDETEESLIES